MEDKKRKCVIFHVRSDGKITLHIIREEIVTYFVTLCGEMREYDDLSWDVNFYDIEDVWKDAVDGDGIHIYGKGTHVPCKRCLRSLAAEDKRAIKKLVRLLASIISASEGTG